MHLREMGLGGVWPNPQAAWMLLDGGAVPDGGLIDADVCIAGGGAAGITLALALADAGRRIILLESGGLEYEAQVQALYAGRNVGDEYHRLDQTRLRFLGGSSNHWGGWCRPLDPIDLEARPWVTPRGWPMTYGELEAYYPRANELCQLGPFDYSASTWGERTGRPILDLDRERVEQGVFQYSPPTRFGVEYGQQLADSEAVTVYLHANAVDLEASRAGGRVERVRVRDLDGRTFHVRSETVVLALGGIENARLLLSSDQSTPGGIGNGNDLVGRCFVDHVRVPGAVLLSGMDGDAAPLYDSYQAVEGGAPRAVRAVLSLPAEVQRRENLLNFGLTISPTAPPSFDADDATGVTGLLRDLQGTRARTTYQINMWPEPLPNSESRVRLGRDVDQIGMRRVLLEHRLEPRTLESARRSLELVAAELSRAGVGRIHLLAGVNDLDEWTTGNVEFSDHHMATTRMDPDPRHGVVDENCRVHDMENLYVAGSSVFPTAGYAHATLTIVALTLRLADHLRAVR